MSNWLNEQIEILHSCGVNIIDAQQIGISVNDSGHGDIHWAPNLFELLPSSQTNYRTTLINRARTSWYMNAPAIYKRILDAATENN